MTLLGGLVGPQVVPTYRVMSAAKASLESCSRVLAADLVCSSSPTGLVASLPKVAQIFLVTVNDGLVEMQGPKNIRVNCLSAGPVNTLAARGIGGFLVSRNFKKVLLRLESEWLTSAVRLHISACACCVFRSCRKWPRSVHRCDETPRRMR